MLETTKHVEQRKSNRGRLVKSRFLDGIMSLIARKSGKLFAAGGEEFVKSHGKEGKGVKEKKRETRQKEIVNNNVAQQIHTHTENYRLHSSHFFRVFFFFVNFLRIFANLSLAHHKAPNLFKAYSDS